MEWIGEHVLEIGGVLAALVVLSWLHGRLRRLFARNARGRSFCRHCNWEGRPLPRKPRCRRCGSPDLSPLTH